MTPGYFRNAQATAARLRGGWLRTGDLGFMDGGELFFVGRADDLLNIGGVKVVPEDAEQAVEALGRPARAGGTCLLGLRNDEGALVPKLLVEVRGPGDWATWQRRARLLLAERFGLWRVALVAVPKGTLERTDTGKPRRRVLAGRLERGEIPVLDFPEAMPPESPDGPAPGRVATGLG